MKRSALVFLTVLALPLLSVSGVAAQGSNFCGTMHIEAATNKLNGVELRVGGTTVSISPAGIVSGFPTGGGFQRRPLTGRIERLTFPTQPRPESVEVDYTPHQIRVITRQVHQGRLTSVFFYYRTAGQNIREPRLPITRMVGSPNNGIIPTARGNRTRMENGCLVAVFE